MKISEFHNLPEVSPHIGEAIVGNLFLQGTSMIEQKTTKKIGDGVSMYKVIDASENSYLITIHFEKLEE